MSDNLKGLIETAGNHVARMVIESHVMYPRTSNLKNEHAIFSAEFSEKTLLETISGVENNIQLKAIDAVKDAVQILKLINEFKSSILLRQADYLVIYKGGFDVLSLKNSDNPNSGKSIYVEINSCRNELIRYIQTLRVKEFPWMEAVVIATALISTGVSVYYHLTNKK